MFWFTPPNKAVHLISEPKTKFPEWNQAYLFRKWMLADKPTSMQTSNLSLPTDGEHTLATFTWAYLQPLLMHHLELKLMLKLILMKLMQLEV